MLARSFFSATLLAVLFSDVAAEYSSKITIKAFINETMIFHNCTMSKGNVMHMPVSVPAGGTAGSSTYVESRGKGFLGSTQGICYFTIPGAKKAPDPYPLGPYVHWCIGMKADCQYFGLDTPLDPKSGKVYGGAGCDYVVSPLQEMKTNACICAPGVLNAECLQLCNCSTPAAPVESFPAEAATARFRFGGGVW